MLGTVVALVALIVFVLPGFIASRVATVGRAVPATIADLEVILRSLAYAVAIHGFWAWVGWTPCLLDKIDGGRNWDDHVGELVGFAASVAGSAVGLGLALALLFDRLEGRGDRASRVVYTSLGGQDVRDAFDYIFLRRKRAAERSGDSQFIVIVHTVDRDDPSVGVYGSHSYFGLSPRPHDLYLEQIWEQSRGRIRRPSVVGGGWFPASSIRRIEFRELSDADVQAGSTRRFGTVGIRDAIRRARESRGRELLAAAEASGVPTNDELIAEVTEVTESVLRFAAPNLPVAEAYERVQEARQRISRLGGAIVNRLRNEDEDLRDEDVIRDTRRYGQRAGNIPPPWDLWAVVVAWHADHLAQTGDPEGDLLSLLGLLVEAMIAIDELDWAEMAAEVEDSEN